MRRSIATVSLSGTLQEKLEAAAAARFDAIEIFENDLLFFEGSAKGVGHIAASLGLEICLFQPFREGLPTGRRSVIDLGIPHVRRRPGIRLLTDRARP